MNNIDNDGQPTSRRPRADSLRNRERLLTAAKTAFAELGADAPLEEIARRAGVGVGTLYRHFPEREALLSAVYRREVDQLCAAADRLVAERAPLEAMEAWLDDLISYMGAKRVILPAIKAASTSESEAAAASSGAAITGAFQRMVEAAAAVGDIRADMTADDILRMLAGVSFGYDQPGWKASARRLTRVLLDGLKTRR